MRPALENPSSTEHLDGTAGRGDGLARTRAERVRPHRERVRHGALAEALEQPALVHEPVRAQLVGADARAGGEGVELADVEDQVRGARDRRQPALRQTALRRLVAPLLSRRAVPARTRAASFVPAPRRLAVARAGS